MVNEMGKGWKNKLPDALWAYRIAYKTPIGMSPYQLVYGKTCHLPAELEHRAHWAIRTWTVRWREGTGRSNYPSWKNGGKKPTTVPRSTRTELRDGTTRESDPRNSR